MEKEMKFTRASEDDKNEILALYRSLAGTEFCAWTENYPGETDIEGDLSREGLFCLKNEREKIVGVISIDQDENVEKLSCWSDNLQPSAELSRVGVRVENQNQGIAGKLLCYGMEELRQWGKRSVHLLACKTNKKALRVYEKLNFNVVGECEMYGEEWWCFEKAL